MDDSFGMKLITQVEEPPNQANWVILVGIWCETIGLNTLEQHTAVDVARRP